MRNPFLRIVVLAAVLILPQLAMAQVHVDINIYAPPPIRYAAPPMLVVLPETYVYVAPDVAEDIFFYDGWWWRPWDGRWYRSRDYDRGWVYYRSVPSFYRYVPRDWRIDYREHRWRKHHWRSEPLQHRDVQRNWKTWKNEKYWERHHSWGVKDLRNNPKPRYQQEPGPQYRQKDKKKYEDHGKHGKHGGGHGNK